VIRILAMPAKALPMPKTLPARLIGLSLPRDPSRTPFDVEDRLTQSLVALRARREGRPVSEDDACTLPEPQTARIRRWSRVYLEGRGRALAPLRGLRPEDRDLVLTAARLAHVSGVIGSHELDERIAALHLRFPWLAPASSAVLHHMRARLHAGSAAFHTPPLILLGPPGIGKSAWARALAEGFDLPAAAIDIGATNGAVFAIAGSERGWGSAAPGRVVQTLLGSACANPVVILDEIDKIPEQVRTSRGSTLPGAFEVLKSMVEPTTARDWTCPALQVPFDLTGVSWVMTTNSVAHQPAAFLDRCQVVRVEGPTTEQLITIGRAMMAERLGEQGDLLAEALAAELRRRANAGRKTNLRDLVRMVERVQEVSLRPVLQ
jgi:hypothetical protein